VQPTSIFKRSPDSKRRYNRLERWKAISVFLLLLALPLVWRWTPLYDWFNLRTVLLWQESVKNHPAALLYVIGIYLTGSLCFFPITILNLATVFAFGSLWGNIYALIGWMASSSEGYVIGRLIGKDILHKLIGRRLAPMVDGAERHGFLTVLAMRVFPVGPFTLVNLFIGASGIRFSHFFWASVIGRLPGIVVLTLFGFQLEYALREPGMTSFALLVFVLIAAPLLVANLVRRFTHRRVRGWRSPEEQR
jgi:phospholipase D1/2